jgi:hypothetical protein
MIEDEVQTIRERMKQILESCQRSVPVKEDQPVYQNHNSNEIGKDPVIPWMLEEWRRTSIPDWQRILKESINSGDLNREKYARWMLKEVLEDPEFQEQEL